MVVSPGRVIVGVAPIERLKRCIENQACYAVDFAGPYITWTLEIQDGGG